MKKITLLSIYSGAVERGVETFTQELGIRLNKKFRVTIYQAGRSKNPQLRTKSIKVRISQPKEGKGILSRFYLDAQSIKILIFTILSLLSLVREKPNLIIPLNGGWQTVIIKLCSKAIGAKMMVMGHAGIGRDDAFNLLCRPDIFIALTSAQASWAKKLTPEVKIVTIPNGVDLERFNPLIKPKELDLEKPIVVCASALTPYKRVELTIKAVAKAQELSLLVLGDGELRGQIDSLGKKLLGKRYLRLVVPYKDIPAYYRAGKVFTLASKTEAFGISYVEAMACNLPVVTTSDDSRAEIIDEVGILTNTSNIEVYAKDLKIAAKTDYKNLPYNRATSFSWNKIAESYASEIEKLFTAKNDLI